jgi:ABC-2 type transport system ATP-binding protein
MKDTANFLQILKQPLSASLKKCRMLLQKYEWFNKLFRQVKDKTSLAACPPSFNKVFLILSLRRHTVIEVSGLTKLYGERKVLHSLDFTVNTGRICGFLGPNGSGKSTTMDILASLLGPSSGSAKICGFDVVTQVMDVKRHVGYLPDNPPLHKEMRVKDFVTYVAKLRDIDVKERANAVDSVMHDCDVTDVADRVVGNLSKGYRQRVALCAALVHRPAVLILDEPTEGLDPNQIVHIRNLIKKLAADRTVILSSHILSEVQATCNEVIIINKGFIVAKALLDTEENKRSIRYTFANKSDEAMQWFKNNSAVQSVSQVQGTLHALVVHFHENFWSNAGKNQAEMTEKLVQQGFPIIGIHEEKVGIDDLFFQAIK